MPKSSKYKSISVNVDTYNQIVTMAAKEKRNISQQLSMIVEKAWLKSGESVDSETYIPRPQRAGLSAVMED